MSKFIGEYPPQWTKEFRDAIRAKAGNKCERCGHPHDPENGYCLTVHHLDNNKSNIEEWNLAALCQRCHLTIQGRVNLAQGWMFDHSDWFRPHLEGYLKSLEIVREQR
jgi:5-methylcytosine-specific restriction endonuclease McrA